MKLYFQYKNNYGRALSNYGRALYYPDCIASAAIANAFGIKSFTLDQLRKLYEGGLTNEIRYDNIERPLRA